MFNNQETTEERKQSSAGPRTDTSSDFMEILLPGLRMIIIRQLFVYEICFGYIGVSEPKKQRKELNMYRTLCSKTTPDLNWQV